MCRLSDFDHLKLDRWHRAMLEAELEDWHRVYLPRWSLQGKTVLETGAGNGETAQLFLNHGAAHVVSIEPDANLLYLNFGTDPRVTIVPEAIQYQKHDCEGGERDMVVETHFPTLIRPMPIKSLSRFAGCNIWRFERLPARYDNLANPLHQIRVQVAHAIKANILSGRGL